MFEDSASHGASGRLPKCRAAAAWQTRENERVSGCRIFSVGVDEMRVVAGDEADIMPACLISRQAPLNRANGEVSHRGEPLAPLQCCRDDAIWADVGGHGP